MKRFLPKKKTVIKYSVLSALLGIGFYFYTDDHAAPVLTDFQFESVSDSATEFRYSGSMTDARGVSKAEFECVEDSQVRLVIVVAMTGADRNKTSFGILSRSPIWSGSWQGTSYELEFSGRAIIPKDNPDISCSWRAKLKDNLGNAQVIENLQETEIRVG